jgi:hypothetical protein
MQQLVRIVKNYDGERMNGWHLLATGVGDGEFTACGEAIPECEVVSKSGGTITCPDCLEVIRYYKTIKIKS